jgi:opacity protein-like surface antigen
MHKGLVILGVAGALALAAAPARAQSQVPASGMTAAGFTVGASMPYDDALDSGVDLGVQIEQYVSPRASIRGKFSGAWFDIESRPFSGTIQPMAFEGNVVYNWEHGKWHPYATGGVGLYHFRFDEADLKSTDNKVGLNFGGGAEYFLTRRDTVLGEVQFRVIPGRTDSLQSDYEPGYWSLVFGYKKYF